MARTWVRIGTWLALAAALAVGLYARFHALGARQLAVDEYYFVQSVGFIRETGLPRFPSGGLYVPGLIPQYLTAAAIELFGNDGFAWRLLPALCSLVAAGLAYLYGRRHLSSLSAAAVAIALLVSSWQIEFGRFARMYAPFQCMTLLFLIVAERAFIDRRRSWLYLPHAACTVMALTHMMGGLLAPLLFLPLLDRTSSPRATPTRTMIYSAVSLATSLFCLAIEGIDFRNWGVADRFPAGVARTGGGLFLNVPELPFWKVSADPQLNLLALIGAITLVAVVLLQWRRRAGQLDEAGLLAAVAAAAAVFRSLAVTAVCLTLLVLRCGIHRPRAHSQRTHALVLVALLCGAGWVLHAWSSAAALSGVCGWPDLNPLFRPWARELPLIGALLLASIAGIVYARASEPWSWILGSPLFVVVYSALCVATLHTSYRTTRYLFFVYPVMLVVIALGAVQAVSRVAGRRCRNRSLCDAGAAGLFLALFLLSGDFSPAHIAGVAGSEVSLRTGRFERYSPTWYPRSDFRSPAQFLNATAGPRDAIVVAAVPPVSFYLAADHALFYERDDLRFFRVARERGTLDLWSNRRLLSSADELRAFAAQHDTLWVVRSLGPGGALPALESILSDPRARPARAMLGQDGRLEVLRIDGLGSTISGPSAGP